MMPSFARRIAAGDEGALEALMRRHNGRLFRVARAILKDDAEAEDALQDAYIDAYRHIDGFRGDAKMSTWLTRIVVNQALGRLRKQKRDGVVLPLTASDRDDREQEEPRSGRHSGGVSGEGGDTRRGPARAGAKARRACRLRFAWFSSCAKSRR
jgi:RNA polymerase sigma factor (sigma-70 family)